jgi:hypothetical protein
VLPHNATFPNKRCEGFNIVPYSAVDETDRFLENHPTFTTSADNAVELLEDLRKDYQELCDSYDEMEVSRNAFKDKLERAATPSEALSHASAQIAELVAFVKRLNAERKISDFELREAIAISKRIAPHSAAPADGASE